MNLIETGKFIAEQRKKKGMTQETLAEKLGVSDRAVSKWERGLSLPDASLMLPLCKELNINVNELLSGKMIDNKDNKNNTDDLLIELAKQNRKLFYSMVTILVTSTLFYFGIICIAINTLEEGPLLGMILCVSTVVYVITAYIALKFEVDAGYYECKKCHHRFVPKYKDVILALHAGTIRYLKCPNCNKRSWAKKVMTK